MADNRYISPFVKDGNEFRSADKTSYDLTNPNPAGGPINDPRSGYSHTYTPDNKYLDNFHEAASPNSAFGIEGDTVIKNNIFEKTKLDIENPLPADLGGPNRTNAVNIPNGTYTNNRSGNKYGESPGGPLKNKDGKIVNNLVQKYSPSKTYGDQFDGLPFPISSGSPQRTQTDTLPTSPGETIFKLKKEIKIP